MDTGLVLPQSLQAPSLVGSPTAVLPPPLADLIPMGHTDDLRTVAQAFEKARDTLTTVAQDLHGSLESLFVNNDSADLDARNDFWNQVGGTSKSAILSALPEGCDSIAGAIYQYADWTDDVQNQIVDAIGNILEDATLGALGAVALGMLTDGLGDIAAIGGLLDAIGDGPVAARVIGAIEGVISAASPQLAAAGAVAGGAVGAMTAAIENTPSPNVSSTETQAVTDTAEENAAEDLANEVDHNTGIHTEACRAPDPNATPGGHPTRIPDGESPENKLALQRENESADVLAKDGYDVEQNPDVPGVKSPDYRIEGQIFDNVAPTTANARSIASRIEQKVAAGQASRIVLNLSDSSVDLTKLSAQLHDWPISGLQEVEVIDAQGNVIDFYPWTRTRDRFGWPLNTTSSSTHRCLCGRSRATSRRSPAQLDCSGRKLPLS